MTRKRRFQEHIARLRELGQADASRRCAFCRRQLPTTGVFMVYGRSELWCSESCHDDGKEASVLRPRVVH